VEDADIVQDINRLVGEYHHLEHQHGGLGLSAEQRKELGELQVRIDRHWEVLRQRRARRHIGADPDDLVLPPPTGRARTSSARR
jgi:hypothetical protein